MRDENNKAIVVQEAYSILNNLKCVIKKTVQTSSGKDVMLCSFKNGIDEKSGKQVKDILFSFGENYIVQELIEQSSQLSTIYDKSVNIFRVMTYRIDNRIYHCPVALRIGRGGSDRDNIHYGGIGVGVNNDGSLKQTAFSEYGDKFYHHPDTSTVFSECRIRGLTQIKEMTLVLPESIPWFWVLLMR